MPSSSAPRRSKWILAIALGSATALAVPACTLFLSDDDELRQTSASSSTATSSSATGTGGSGTGASDPGGSGGGGGDGFGGAPTCDHLAEGGDAPYRMKRAKADFELVDDLSCAEFADANSVRIRGACSSDNTVDCRLLWAPVKSGEPSIIYGCCHVRDTNLNAHQDPNVYGETSRWWLDDSVEYIVSPKTGQDAGYTSTTTKSAFTITGGHYDNGYVDGGAADGSLFDGQARVMQQIDGIYNSTTPARGYVLKWSEHLAFEAKPGEAGGFNLKIYDCDQGDQQCQTTAGKNTTVIQAYEADAIAFNDPLTWGTCVFEE